MNIANILEEDRKLKDAHTYAKVSANTYTNVFQDENPTSIKALWQLLSISYSLKKEDTQ
jgi:hypothetical protein